MKATELMIDDWVLYGRNPVQVLQLSQGREYKDISPIPLTEEILDKNFERQSLGEYILPFKLPYVFYWDIQKHYGFLEDHCLIQIEYVHQLQQLLRLCGIQKEIQL